MQYSYTTQHPPQSPICPYCHSLHTQWRETRTLESQQHLPKLSTFSPMTLASIGMQVSRRFHMPPLLGGLAGLVMGGMVLLYVNLQKPLLIMRYQCEQCMGQFEIQCTD